MPQTHDQFTADMDKAGFEVEEYHGRFFYHGPAVRTDEENGPTLQDVMAASSVRVQWDNMGFDWIVYPI